MHVGCSSDIFVYKAFVMDRYFIGIRGCSYVVHYGKMHAELMEASNDADWGRVWYTKIIYQMFYETFHGLKML